MSRRVKEFVDVADQLSIDELIEKLSEIRDGLPQNADAELRLRGDDVFGHRITITYFRDQTPEEAEIEKRYAEAAREAKERELAAATGGARRGLLRGARQAREAEDRRLGLVAGNGGAGGIRTLDTVLPYTHFPGERLRPLGHRSAFAGRRDHLGGERAAGKVAGRNDRP